MAVIRTSLGAAVCSHRGRRNARADADPADVDLVIGAAAEMTAGRRRWRPLSGNRAD